MRVHFWRRHVRDTVIILEEGNLPHPRCENCDMLVPWRSLNGRHKDKAMCRSGAERKRRQDTAAEVRESAERDFEAYGDQLESVPRFTYLGRVMTAGGRRLAGGGRKPKKGAEELGEAKEDIGEGGRDGADIGGFLQGRGATSPIIWGRDMGSNPKDGKGAKRVSTWGG